MRLGRPGPQEIGNENMHQMVNRAVKPTWITTCRSASNQNRPPVEVSPLTQALTPGLEVSEKRKPLLPNVYGNREGSLTFFLDQEHVVELSSLIAAGEDSQK